MFVTRRTTPPTPKTTLRQLGDGSLWKKQRGEKVDEVLSDTDSLARPSDRLNYFASYCRFCVFICVVSGPSLHPSPSVTRGAPFVYVFIPSRCLPPRPRRRVSSVRCLFGSDHPTPTPQTRLPTLAQADGVFIFTHTRLSLNRRPFFMNHPGTTFQGCLLPLLFFSPAALTASTRTLFTDGSAGEGGRPW